MRDPLPPPRPSGVGDTCFLLGLCIFSGLLLVTTGSSSDSVQALLPFWLTTIWGALLIGGATLALTGLFWRDQLHGLFMEFVGRFVFAIFGLIHATILTLIGGRASMVEVVPLVGFCVVCLLRARDVRRDIDEVREVLDTMTRAQEGRDEP